jgi:hypothetical protein
MQQQKSPKQIWDSDFSIALTEEPNLLMLCYTHCGININLVLYPHLPAESMDYHPALTAYVHPEPAQ